MKNQWSFLAGLILLAGFTTSAFSQEGQKGKMQGMMEEMKEAEKGMMQDKKGMMKKKAEMKKEMMKEHEGMMEKKEDMMKKEKGMTE